MKNLISLILLAATSPLSFASPLLPQGSPYASLEFRSGYVLLEEASSYSCTLYTDRIVIKQSYYYSGITTEESIKSSVASPEKLASLFKEISKGKITEKIHPVDGPSEIIKVYYQDSPMGPTREVLLFEENGAIGSWKVNEHEQTPSMIRQLRILCPKNFGKN